MNVQYSDEVLQTSRPNIVIDLFENSQLLSHERLPVKMILSKLKITFGNKTSTLLCSKNQITKKSAQINKATWKIKTPMEP